MASSLLKWGDIYRRWLRLGLSLSIATVTVESGFSAHSVLMFDKQTKYVTFDTFSRHSQLVVLALNYNLLHKWNLPDIRSTDKRILYLLESAHERLCASEGLASMPVSVAGAKFRAVVRQHRDLAQEDEEIPS